VIEEYAVMLYKGKELHNIPKSDIQFTIADQLFLDVLLMKIRSKTIGYATMKKRNTLKQEQQLEESIKFLEQKTGRTDNESKTLEDLKIKLVESRSKTMEGVLLRSRARWMAEGERVSKYFCSLEKRNVFSKHMKKLITQQGKELFNQNEINNEVGNFYESLYKKRIVEDCEITDIVQNIPTLSNEEAGSIEGKITMEEATTALKNMKNNKSPGTDGFTSEFFKVFWKQIGSLVVRSLNDGFEKSELSVTQKEGIIVCIPKGDKPREYIKNWRPISLLNVVYKIGSSCIANRLKNVLPSLINEDQTGFMVNRYMGDNIRLIYDLICYLNYNNIPGLLLCIDFEKAFDSVDWNFMMKVLKAFGFGPSICQWVQTFYMNIKSCVIVNGHVTPWFLIGRGCRQGDPISPYLFLLCVEILGIMVRENEVIRGITINDEEHKIVQFADDTQMMSEGDANSFEQSIRTIDSFGKKSGLFMNSGKTQAIWLGSKRRSSTRYLPHIKMDWNPQNFKILGVWLTVDLTDCEETNYNDKFSEIKILFRIWIKRSITPLGRIAVLKSLILSKLVHLWMLLPNPPDGFTDSLQKLCFKFVWNRKQDRISRKTVIKSTKKGGLGLFDLRQFMNGLKLIWIRKLMNGNHRWKNIIFAMFPILKSLDVHGPCFPLNKDKVNRFWMHTLQAYKHFSCKI
jgi:hypothetical protein